MTSVSHNINLRLISLMLVPTSSTKGIPPVEVVVVVPLPTLIPIAVVVDPILMPTKAGGVEDKIILLIGLFAKSTRSQVMLLYSVITGLITPTPLRALLQCKLFLPLLNKLLIKIGTLTHVPLIMLLMILPI